MLVVQNITKNYRQKQILTLPDGTTISFSIRFSPMQFSWFIENLIYGRFQLNGIRICNSPNLLRQFKNQIPFGLACFSVDTREPQLLEDFFSEHSTMYILTAAEVAQYEAYLSNG